jgi:hypothetical protein
MGSPFPGTDPYIEACGLWEDLHDNLIIEMQVALSSRLPDRYVVRAGERAYVVMSRPGNESREHRFRPEVGVAATAAVPTAVMASSRPADSLMSDDESGPIAICAFVETEYREIFLEIRLPPPAKRLVTCIEVLSPSNKSPGTKGWRLYNRKRRAYLSGQAHFVEIDLLRGGRRFRMADDWPDSPYYLLACRKNEAALCKVWPAFFNRPLPRNNIPLLAPDPDIALDLQPLVEKIYTRSRYQRDIDYGQPIEPPLSPAETAWLQERLREPREPTR